MFCLSGQASRPRERGVTSSSTRSFSGESFPWPMEKTGGPTKQSQSLQPHEDKHYTYTLSLGYAERKPQHKVQGGCSPQLHTGDALGTSVRAKAPFSLHVLEQTA